MFLRKFLKKIRDKIANYRWAMSRGRRMRQDEMNRANRRAMGRKIAAQARKSQQAEKKNTFFREISKSKRELRETFNLTREEVLKNPGRKLHPFSEYELFAQVIFENEIKLSPVRRIIALYNINKLAKQDGYTKERHLEELSAAGIDRDICPPYRTPVRKVWAERCQERRVARYLRLER